MRRLVAITSRFVSAEPTGIGDEPIYKSPPVGGPFVTFIAVLVAWSVLTLVEVGAPLDLSAATVAQMGMVGATVFLLAGIATGYRAVTTRSPTILPIVIFLLGPGALWCWLVVVRDTATGGLATTIVVVASALVGAALLIEGLWRARWLGVFCGLGAVGLSIGANLIRSNSEVRSTVSFALLLVTAGLACLYGTLVEIEASGQQSFEDLLVAKRRIEEQIRGTEDLLHDLRSGLLSIEAAMATLGDDIGGPLKTEAARLRRLVAKGGRNPVEFDVVEPVREMVKARRSSGMTIDLRAPTSARIVGEESEVLAIVDNLLSNAMRHGSDPINVIIDEHDGYLSVRVSDSGRMEESVAAGGLFRRGVSSHADGDGIGLDRARMLAEMHNGSVRYLPSEDGRTSFVLTLPSGEFESSADVYPITGGQGDPAVVRWTPSRRSS